MTSCSIVKLLIFFNFLTHFTVCNRDSLLAFTGCNATLQWDTINSSYEQERTDFRIIDNAGDVIATKENNQCMSKNNLSMSCVISHKNDDWIILLTLMNITTNHTGNYTAWIKNDDLPLSEKKTKPLIVIDKPQIMELRKPVLYQSFTVLCTTSYTSDCINYYWKINDSDLQASINLHATMSNLTYRNVTMIDNFSRLTCRAGIEKCSNVMCNSSEESDPYTVEPYYGPMYVSLALNESHIYLEENTTFKVKCSANCYPACAFRWESYYINVDNEELLINNFNEIHSGPYTCTARNRETGVTAKSYPLLLHHAKEAVSMHEEAASIIVSTIGSDTPEKENSRYLLGVGLVIVAVCLIIVGALIFVTHRRKYDSRAIISLAVNQPCAGPTNREITQDFLRFKKQDRPLPTPAVPDSLHRIPRRSWYPNRNRKSLSLHSFSNHDQALWRPVRQSLSLQSLIQLSHEIGRLANSDDSLCKQFCSKKGRRFSIAVSETGIRAEELYSKVQNNKNVGYNGKKPDAISSSLINVRPHSSTQEQQELYNTIDEASWSEYDYARSNNQVENLQDNQRNTDTGNYDYDYAFLTPL